MNETTVADENTLFGSYRKWSEVTLWRYAVGLGYDSSSLGQNVEGQKMNISFFHVNRYQEPLLTIKES